MVRYECSLTCFMNSSWKMLCCCYTTCFFFNTFWSWMLEPWSNINYNIGSIFLVNNFLVQVKVILVTEETNCGCSCLRRWVKISAVQRQEGRRGCTLLIPLQRNSVFHPVISLTLLTYFLTLILGDVRAVGLPYQAEDAHRDLVPCSRAPWHCSEGELAPL